MVILEENFQHFFSAQICFKVKNYITLNFRILAYYNLNTQTYMYVSGGYSMSMFQKFNVT